MRLPFFYFFLIVTISIGFQCKIDPYSNQRIEFLDYFPESHNSVYVMDSLALNNHRTEAIKFYNSIDKSQLSDTERIYLTYRYNKSVFWENFYNRDTSYSFYCELNNDQRLLLNILSKLSNYYSDELTDLNFATIDKIIKYIDSYNMPNNLLRIELLSEIGRYYYNEGYIEADSSVKYFEASLKLTKKNSETTVTYDDIKTLIYLHLAKRDKNRFLFYSNKFTKTQNTLYDFNLENQIQESYLKGMAFFYNGFKEKGISQYNKAFTMCSSLKFKYLPQEVYKTYISFRNAYIDSISVRDKYKTLESIVQNEGDFNNFNRVKGEFRFSLEKIDSQVYQSLKYAYSYACRQKPYMKTQAYTILNMLGLTCKKMGLYDQALNSFYTENGKSFTRGLKHFCLDSVTNFKFQSQKYYFVSLQNYCSVLINKYLISNRLNYLFLADSLCRYSESILKSQYHSLNEGNLILLLNQVNEIYHSGQQISYLLYKRFRNNKYIFKYFYYLEQSKYSLLLRDMRLENASVENIRELHNLEMKVKAKIEFLKTQDNFGDSLKYYVDKLDSIGRLTQNIDVYKVFSNDISINYDSFEVAIRTKIIESLKCFLDLNYTNEGVFILKLKSGNSELYYKPFTSNFNDTIKYVTNTQNGTIAFDTIKYSRFSNYIYKLLELNKCEYNLVVSSNELLSKLNFEALIIDTNTQFNPSLKYYIYSHSIEYTPSLRLFLASYKLSNSNQNVAGFFYSDMNSLKLNPSQLSELPGNLMEYNSLLNYSKNCVVYSGLNCTKSNILNLKGEYKIVHIGTHGVSNTNNLNDLCLFFRNNYFTDTLSIYDMYKMKWKSELVILSSCESRSGKSISGEGIFSLTRLFLLYGSDKVISSLWNLDDECSSYLFSYFYDYIIQGCSYSEALTFSKLKILEKFPKFNKPFYWAGII